MRYLFLHQGKFVKPLDDEAKDVLKRLREVFASEAKESVPSLKCRNRLEVEKQLRLVNGVAGNLAVFCQSISEVNHLLYACSFVVAECLGLKKKKAGGRREKEEPWWKRRIEKKVKEWRKDLSRIEELRRKNWKPSEAERSRMNKVYDLDCKGANEVCAFLKSKIFSSSIKVKRYEERKTQFHQNTLVRNGQSKLYAELNGKTRGNAEAPKAKEATKFWSDVWSKAERHAEDAAWLERVKRKLNNVEKQRDLLIDVDMVRSGLRRLSNWKAPGPDGVVGFWFKKLSSVHAAMAENLQLCLEKGKVPLWMVKGRLCSFRKIQQKGM